MAQKYSGIPEGTSKEFVRVGLNPVGAGFTFCGINLLAIIIPGLNKYNIFAQLLLNNI
jgi:hypothetical protein